MNRNGERSTRTDIETFVREKTQTVEFRDELASMVLDLCSIDSTPDSDTAIMRQQERAAFDLIRRIVSAIDLDFEVMQRMVDYDRLQKSESYTPPYYTHDSNPYHDRGNLVVVVRPGSSPQPSPTGSAIAVNAHVDTVHPHVPPERRGERVFGRGACDDKGNVAVMLGAVSLLGKISQAYGVAPRQNIVLMFVIDEESGGNGSVALALDRELKAFYDELVVLECCDSIVYPANRGAIWYRIELPSERFDQPLRMASKMVLSLEEMGREIRAESNDPLFPDPPVQTCHGIWGPWGEHPSRVCGYVELTAMSSLTEQEIQECLDRAIDRYVAIHGDKTKILQNGQPAVPWHYQLAGEDHRFTIRIMGRTGHMAALKQNDGALTKAAHIIDELYDSDPRISVTLVNHPEGEGLVLEGGQSFISTHSLQHIKERIWEACRPVLTASGINPEEVRKLVTMDKLHNAAFSSDPESSLFLSARESLSKMELSQPKEPRGWGASCDARIFAGEYPDMPVVTMGAGDLDNAHADDESVSVPELAQNVAALTLLLLDRTGAAPASEP
jgi:acetylornithine deacetylase/succinyl-diaminopimelate desuccinylase-like protein